MKTEVRIWMSGKWAIYVCSDDERKFLKVLRSEDHRKGVLIQYPLLTNYRVLWEWPERTPKYVKEAAEIAINTLKEVTR